MLSLGTGSIEDITYDEPAQAEVIDDDQVYPTELVLEPQSGPEADEAPVEEAYAVEEVCATVEEAYTVEEVPAPLHDAWDLPTTLKSGMKKKKRSRN